jgi:2'-5' RNA ligase
MRLFIAINFSSQVKSNLYNIAQKLKSFSTQGNFTGLDNFHLTLIFLGETTKINSIKQAMNKIDVLPFKFALRGLGKFHRRGGDIYWVGVEKNRYLLEVYNKLCEELADLGFDIEERDFKPHVTLGRKVILNSQFNYNEFIRNIFPITIEVDRISLMKSERINETLAYTEVYSKVLVN